MNKNSDLMTQETGSVKPLYLSDFDKATQLVAELRAWREMRSIPREPVQYKFFLKRQLIMSGGLWDEDVIDKELDIVQIELDTISIMDYIRQQEERVSTALEALGVMVR